MTDESGVLSAGTIFESGSAPSIVDFAEDLEVRRASGITTVDYQIDRHRRDTCYMVLSRDQNLSHQYSFVANHEYYTLGAIPKALALLSCTVYRAKCISWSTTETFTISRVAAFARPRAWLRGRLRNTQLLAAIKTRRATASCRPRRPPALLTMQ